MVYGEDVAISIVLDTITESEKLFVNGQLKKDNELTNDYWNSFKEELVSSVEDGHECDTVVIGRGQMDRPNVYYYSNLDCYALRLYGRALTDR